VPGVELGLSRARSYAKVVTGSPYTNVSMSAYAGFVRSSLTVAKGLERGGGAGAHGCAPALRIGLAFAPPSSSSLP